MRWHNIFALRWLEGFSVQMANIEKPNQCIKIKRGNKQTATHSCFFSVWPFPVFDVYLVLHKLYLQWPTRRGIFFSVRPKIPCKTSPEKHIWTWFPYIFLTKGAKLHTRLQQGQDESCTDVQIQKEHKSCWVLHNFSATRLLISDVTRQHQHVRLRRWNCSSKRLTPRLIWKWITNFVLRGGVTVTKSSIYSGR